jgi:hypothetical protein
MIAVEVTAADGNRGQRRQTSRDEGLKSTTLKDVSQQNDLDDILVLLLANILVRDDGVECVADAADEWSVTPDHNS